MITVISGPPCAGKTTHAMASAKDGDVIIDFDALATAFGSPGHRNPPPAIRHTTHAARDAAIATVLDGIESDAWIIHTQPNSEQLQRYSDAGAVVQMVDPGQETCLRRAIDEGRPVETVAAIENWYTSRKGLGHMDIKTKTVEATIEDVEGSSGPGEFVVALTTEDLDREGDELKGNEWQLPLPDHITFVNDHTHKVNSIVGSAIPTLEDGKVMCRGTYATTQNAQDTRQLVKGGHLPNVSVAFREKRDSKSGKVTRELINGSFVVVPANPNAKVLASKSIGVEAGELTDEARDYIKSIVEQALSVKSETSAPEAPAVAADSSADQEKATPKTLAAQRAKALTFATRYEFPE